MIFIPGDVRGIKKVWILGDNFLASTFRPCYKKGTVDMYLKNEFEVNAFCSSKFNDKNQNIISRMQITFANALNGSKHLPYAMMILMDDDLIEYLNYKNFGVSTMYGTWVEYLIKELESLILAKKSYLPRKAVMQNNPIVYWVALPTHKGMGYDDTLMRTKFNLTMETVVRQYTNMRVLKLKDPWDNNDDNNITNQGKFTTKGLVAYWKALDNAFRFNYQKR